MKKRSIVSFLMALMFVMLCLTGCGKSAERTVEEARSGVVRILVMDREVNFRFISGFGVGVAGEPTRWFVTTALPLDDFGEDIRVWIAEEDITFGDGTVDTSMLIPCRIMEQGPIAIIVAERAPEGRVALPLALSDQSAELGDKVFALGYPPLEAPLGPAGAIPATAEACGITESIVERRIKSGSFDDLKIILHSGDYFSSCAGGPLIDEKGEVVGVLMAASDEPDGCVSLDVSYVKEILEEYDAFYGEKETSPALVGSITLLTVVVVAAILFHFREEIQLQVMMIFWKIQEKREKLQEKEPDGDPPPPDPAARYILVCMGGRYEGKRFYLRDHVTIGRDPQWSYLVYSKDEGANIAGRHCILLCDKTQLWLKNCEISTTLYGPSLEERRMLKINEVVELHPGDMIWLGNGKNWFQIENAPSFMNGPIC